MAARLLEHPAFDSHDLNSLRSFPLGGARFPGAPGAAGSPDSQLQGRGMVNMWGMTEGGGFFTVATGADLQRFPGQSAAHCPPSNCGSTIRTRADRRGARPLPTVMLGYAGIYDGTVDSAGWLRTGDLGHLNDSDYLFIDGRNGHGDPRRENIARPHVEAALMRHPDVVEAAAIGLPHPDLGEELGAVVVTA